MGDESSDKIGDEFVDELGDEFGKVVTKFGKKKSIYWCTEFIANCPAMYFVFVC